MDSSNNMLTLTYADFQAAEAGNLVLSGQNEGSLKHQTMIQLLKLQGEWIPDDVLSQDPYATLPDSPINRALLWDMFEAMDERYHADTYNGHSSAILKECARLGIKQFAKF